MTLQRIPLLLTLVCLLLVGGACNRDAAPAAPAPDPATATADAVVQASRSSTPPRLPDGSDQDDPDAPLPPSVTMPSADTDTPLLAEGATVNYDCDDGYLVVAYGNGVARMTLPDGSRSDASLSVEASARTGGEVYIGNSVGLHRLGNVVEVQGADNSKRRCIETSSDA